MVETVNRLVWRGKGLHSSRMHAGCANGGKGSISDYKVNLSFQNNNRPCLDSRHIQKTQMRKCTPGLGQNLPGFTTPSQSSSSTTSPMGERASARLCTQKLLTH